MSVEKTYQQFSDKFDLVHAALNGGWSLDTAIRMGFKVTYVGDFIKAEPRLDPSLYPLASNQRNIYKYGDQFGRQFDPSQWGMPHSRPNQGYGNWLNGKPLIPEPTWSILPPHIVPPRPRPDDALRPHLKPY